MKKEMKKEIEEKYSAIPERQIETGIYMSKVGSKYVHVLHTWDNSYIEKWLIEDFYNQYIK